ncbi:hypothetical protein HN873_033615 [Arachis hypogaea]
MVSMVKLFGKKTGLECDYTKHTVDAPNEWWEKKQLVCPWLSPLAHDSLGIETSLPAALVGSPHPSCIP